MQTSLSRSKTPVLPSINAKVAYETLKKANEITSKRNKAALETFND
jgi:hypothetical protein